MSKTNSGLVAYAKAQIGLPYWYGTYGQKGSKALYEAKKKQYPKYYKAKDYPSQYGKRVHDCAGLIKGYLWSSSPTATPKYDAKTDYGATGFYSHAKHKGTISSFKKIDGQLVFKGSGSKMTHVGVYVGGYVIEAKGHAYGVVKSKFNSTWTHWAQCNLIIDDTSKPQPTPEPTPTPTPAPSNKYKVKTKSGQPLALRESAKVSSKLIEWMPNGSEITVDGFVTGQEVYGSTSWAHATYKNKSGYCTATRIEKT